MNTIILREKLYGRSHENLFELLSKMSDEQFEAHKSIIEEIHSSGGVLSQDDQFNLALKMLNNFAQSNARLH